MGLVNQRENAVLNLFRCAFDFMNYREATVVVQHFCSLKDLLCMGEECDCFPLDGRFWQALL